MEDVQNNCIAIIEELCAGSVYVTFEAVVMILLDRYSISCFEVLGFGPPSTVPILALLLEIQSKVSSYLHIYFSDQGPSVKSMLDLDEHIFRMLRSFGIPSLNVYIINKLCKPDPNEIDIDAADCLPLSEPCSFADYGLGSLSQNPTVLNIFPETQKSDLSTKLSTEDLLSHLVEFVTEVQTAKGDSENACITIKSFECYLLQRYRVKSTTDIGVILTGNMQPELQMASHIWATHRQSIEEYQKRIINDILLESSVPSKIRDRKHQQSNFEVTGGDGFKITLRQPIRSAASAFVTECSSRLQRKRDNSPYPPSFAQVLEAVRDNMKQNTGTGDADGVQSQEGRKRKKSKAVSASYDITPEFVEIAAEYVMLHVGGSRYLKKQFVQTSSSDSERAGEDEGSDEETFDQSSTQVQADVLKNATENHSCEQVLASRNADEIPVPGQTSRGRDDAHFDVASTTREKSKLDESHAAELSFVEAKMSTPRTDEKMAVAINLMPTLEPFDFCAMVAANAGIFEVTGSQLVSLAPWLGSLDTTDTRSVGRWGESLVYQYLLFISRGFSTDVCWINELEETRAAYDLTVTKRIGGGREMLAYVEVKSTRFAHNNVFEISQAEWDFATGLPRVRYCIFRVFGISSDLSHMRIVIVSDIVALMATKKIKLCMAV